MRIGLTYNGSPEKYRYYEDWLGDKEMSIVRLWYGDKNADDVDNCDALVLSGGLDIHPKFYGNTTLMFPNADEFDEARDEFEIDMFIRATQKQIPVLGICRGMQLINCILNGDLKQDLGDLNTVHRGSPNRKHEVRIEQGSLLFEIAGELTAEANSSHHQAIDRLGDGLRISGRSADGVVEAIEWNDKAGKPFMLAVQWHPERMFRCGLENSSLSKALRDRFIKEVTYHNKRK